MKDQNEIVTILSAEKEIKLSFEKKKEKKSK